MSEVMRPETIQPDKATTSDMAISWMCDHWQENKPGNFRDRKNITFVDEVVGEPGGAESKIVQKKKEVDEHNLEIVTEVVGLYDTSRKEGNITSKEKNPLGEDLRDVLVIFSGDTHIPGSDLEEEVYEKNEPYIFFKKIRALFVGVKREVDAAKENEPADYPAVKKALKGLGDRLRAAYKILRSKDGEMDDLRDEIREEDGINSFIAFLSLKNAFIRKIKTERDSLTDESKVLIAHVGDNISNEQKMGDVAYSAAQLEEMRRDVGSYSGVDAVFTKTQGNHDTDLINYGLEHDAFDRELFGSQVFLQEVGDDLLILSLNTNFHSTFWNDHLERRKISLQERINRVEGMGDDDKKRELVEINERELAALKLIRKEMKVQEKLIKEAKDSGKRIVLMGHQRGYLEQAMGGNLKETGVVALVSGHTELHGMSSSGENSFGEPINYLNVGADKKVDTDDGEKHVLSGFSLRVKDDDGELSIDIQEIIPNADDYQEAVHSM